MHFFFQLLLPSRKKSKTSAAHFSSFVTNGQKWLASTKTNIRGGIELNRVVLLLLLRTAPGYEKYESHNKRRRSALDTRGGAPLNYNVIIFEAFRPKEFCCFARYYSK